MGVLLLSRDLASISHVDGVASRVGLSSRSVSSAEDAIAASAGDSACVVIIDLNSDVDVNSLVTRLRASTNVQPLRIIAFGPHVHVDRLMAAAEAGCEVMSRGQFFSQLANVLRGEG